jgi:hypothetical protein
MQISLCCGQRNLFGDAVLLHDVGHQSHACT